MNSLSRRLVALAATFVLGIATNTVVNRVYPRFESVGMGYVTMRPEGHGGFTAYRSREGVNLIWEHFRFPSPEAANTASQRMLTDANTIVEREVLYDRERKHITGERVIITFRTETGIDAVAIIGVDKSHLYYIASTSLRHALAFDRRHRRY